MALDFPATPTPGQTFQRWQWDAKHWSVPNAPTSGVGIPGPSGPAGPTGLNATDLISGLLIPYYLPPNNPYSDTNVQRLLDVMKKYHDVPVMVIINPSNGPGATADPNYANFIKLLHGAGGVVLGYVATGFGLTSATTVKTDIDKWRTLYAAQPPDGIFLDEMPWDVGPGNVGTAYVDKYKDYTDYCHLNGFTPTVGNPGTNQQPAWFATYTADVIVVHEDLTYPSEASMEGNYIGGHADYPYNRRAALVYNQPTLDYALLDTLRKNVQWVYVTNDNLTGGVLNPWDTLPTYLEQLFAAVQGVTAGDITSVTVGTGLAGGGVAGDITVAMTVPVLVANGGTGAGTAPAALANLGGLPLTGGVLTGALGLPALGPPNAAVYFGAGNTGNGFYGSGTLVGVMFGGQARLTVDGTQVFSQGPINLPGLPTLAAHAASKAYVDGFLPLTGGTLSANLALKPASGNVVLTLNKPTATDQNIFYGLKADSARWALVLGDSGPESTGNLGSNFSISRFTDAGAFIDAPLTISRATGVATFLTVTSNGFTATGNSWFQTYTRFGNTTAPAQTTQVAVCIPGSTYGIGLRPNVAGVGGMISFENQGSALIGSITNNDTSVAYNVSSDGELKEDLKGFDAGPIIDGTSVYDFAWIATGERAHGVVAQEAAAVYPEAVTHLAEFWGVDYSKYVPLLLQEVKALRARLAAGGL